MQDVNYLAELFTSTSLWSLLGPAILVTIIYALGKKDRGLGFIWYMVSILIAFGFYMDLALANAYFNWHIIIIVVGGFLVWVLDN